MPGNGSGAGAGQRSLQARMAELAGAQAKVAHVCQERCASAWRRCFDALRAASEPPGRAPVPPLSPLEM